MRLRTLDLPSTYDGDKEIPHFMLVMDQCSKEEADILLKSRDSIEDLKHSVGASGVMVAAFDVKLDSDLYHTRATQKRPSRAGLWLKWVFFGAGKPHP